MKRDALLSLVVVVVVVVGVALFALGFLSGQHHPPGGKLLVPTHGGKLHDLPGWACRDIVDLREQKVELFQEVVRAYTKPRDLGQSFIFKFGNGDRRSCRG